MSRKKIELTEKVAKLTEKYLEVNDTDFNDLINKALKTYLIDHLNSSQVKDALKKQMILILNTLANGFRKVLKT